MDIIIQKEDPSKQQNKFLIDFSNYSSLKPEILEEKYKKKNWESVEVDYSNPNTEIANSILDILLKIESSPQQLYISFPVNNQVYSTYDLNCIQKVCKVILNLKSNLKQLKLDIKGWGSHNLHFNNECLITIFKSINEISTLQEIRLKFFDCGISNTEITGESISIIFQELYLFQFKENIQILQIDMGRWGCEDYNSYQCIYTKNVKDMTDCIKGFQNLTHLSLNLRSWGYFNLNINMEAIDALQDLFQNLFFLQSLSLVLHNWGYENSKIAPQTINILLDALKDCKLLGELEFIFNTIADEENLIQFVLTLSSFVYLQKVVISSDDLKMATGDASNLELNIKYVGATSNIETFQLQINSKIYNGLFELGKSQRKILMHY